MKKPIAFQVNARAEWVPPTIGSGYDQVNNSRLVYPDSYGHRFPSPQTEPSGYVFEPDHANGIYGVRTHFIEDEEFEARLKFTGASKNFDFTDVDRDNSLSMFRTEFMALVDRVSLVGGRPVNGLWRFLNRGRVPGIALVRELSDA